MSESVRLLLLFLFLLVLKFSLITGLKRGDVEPKISIGGWLEKDVGSQWNYNASPPLNTAPFPYSISVPSTIQGLTLICNASYPIEWRFHQERWNWRVVVQFAVKTTRFSNGLDVVGFSSELSLLSFESNSLTGNYTCQKVGVPELSSSMYVFWEGTSPPYLTLARRYRKPPEIPFQRESETFVLPCTVSVPSVVPSLSKEGEKQQEVPITQNRSVIYDPRVGFIMKRLKDPFGRYTCQVGDVEEDGDGDIITFNVFEGDDSPKLEFNETMRHGAYYTIDSTNKEITCCSAGDKAPKLKLISCGHPTICAIAKHNLHDMESKKKKNGSCSTVQFRTLHSGVFRCVGMGIDVVREFFYPMPEDPRKRWRGGFNPNKGNQNASTPTEEPETDVMEPYYDWYEADSSKMMEVTELSAPIYVGETKKFTCKVSHFYYAQGIVWAIVYTNQSIEYLDTETEKVEVGHRHHGNSGRSHHFDILFGSDQAFIEMTIMENLDTVICYAPVWNSSEWGKKGIEMEVRLPTRPKLIGKTREDITWLLNDTDKSLKCKFGGEPEPQVVWLRNSKNISKSIHSENGSSIFVFHRVSLEAQSEYECRVTNVAGSVTKKFRVTVIHSTSSVLMAVSTISVLGLIFILVACLILCRYLKSQKSVIQHLANLAFKDVNTAGNTTPSQQNDLISSSASSGVVCSNTNGSSSSTSSSVNHSTIPSPEDTRDRAGTTNDMHESADEPLPADPGGYQKF